MLGILLVLTACLCREMDIEDFGRLIQNGKKPNQRPADSEDGSSMSLTDADSDNPQSQKHFVESLMDDKYESKKNGKRIRDIESDSLEMSGEDKPKKKSKKNDSSEDSGITEKKKSNTKRSKSTAKHGKSSRSASNLNGSEESDDFIERIQNLLDAEKAKKKRKH